MSNTNECIICCKDSEIFARGQCDHPVCFICMTRIRALCNQNECPICRNTLEKVIFSPEQKLFNEFLEDASKYEYNDFYKIYFTTADCQSKFINLLANKCNLCPDRVLPSFDSLKIHARKQHDLFFCELCVAHIKLFPWERLMYSRKDYATHRRTGDKGISSMKGHPLCEYCDTRFFDKDTLYRHLRTEHYFCHICDAEGSNDFYAELPSLRDHFRDKHFLCEEDNCAQEHFTSVFRSEIDLKAHKALYHARNMSKGESKSMRNIDVNFQMLPRNRASALDSSLQFDESTNNQAKRTNNLNIDATNETEFPSLDPMGSKTSNTVVPVATHASVTKKFGRSNLVMTQENFPALGPSASNPNVIHRIVKPASNIPAKKGPTVQEISRVKIAAKPPSKNKNMQNKQKPQTPVSDEDEFPSLPYNHDLQKIHRVERPAPIATAKKAPTVQESSKVKIAAKPLNKIKNMQSKQKPQTPVSDEEDFPLLPYNHDLQKNFKISLQKKSAPLLEYSSLAKAEAKINIIKKDEPEKGQTNNKSVVQNLNINSDLSFPVLEKKKISKPTPQKLQLKDENNKIVSNNQKTQNGKNIKKLPVNSNESIFNKQKVDLQLNGDINHYKYIDPPNEASRNQQLKQRLCKIVNNRDTFNEFQLASKMFVNDKYSPSTYFEHCRLVLGDNFTQLFPELVVLLPNIRKQRELYEVLSNTDNVSRKILTRLKSCATCGQIHLSAEGDYHEKKHELNEVFPAL